MTYTFTKIDEKVIELEITFDDGSKFKDKMQGVPTDSKESLDAFVSEYAKAYLAGKYSGPMSQDKIESSLRW